MRLKSGFPDQSELFHQFWLRRRREKSGVMDGQIWRTHNERFIHVYAEMPKKQKPSLQTCKARKWNIGSNQISSIIRIIWFLNFKTFCNSLLRRSTSSAFLSSWNKDSHLVIFFLITWEFITTSRNYLSDYLVKKWWSIATEWHH